MDDERARNEVSDASLAAEEPPTSRKATDDLFEQGRKSISVPLAVAVIGSLSATIAAVVTSLVTVRVAEIASQDEHALAAKAKEASSELEREKFRFELIKLAVGGRDKESAVHDLKFLIGAGILASPSSNLRPRSPLDIHARCRATVDGYPTTN
jgi:hypothetical protein